MLKIVCGVFSLMAGFSALGYAFSHYAVSSEIEQLSRMLSSATMRQLGLSSLDFRTFCFFLILSCIFFVLGAFLIKVGDDERRQRLIADLRELLPSPSQPSDF